MSHSKELAAGLGGAQRSDRPLLGLFTGGTMTEWTGPVAALGEGTPPQKCKTDNRPANEPSLPAMTKKAIELLEGDRDGFFLQVEGASIDQQDHAANACAQIGEMVAFDDAIAPAQAYARPASPGGAAVGGTTDHTDLFDVINRANGRR